MHQGKRLFFFIIFIILFIALIPVVLLYSTGYRLDKTLSLLPTGGIYVFYPETGAQLYIDGELSDQTSLFYRGIFVDNLPPDNYDIEVRKEGYTPWKKTVDVRAKKVAEGYPFLIPEVISTSTIPQFITLTSGTSVTNGLYSAIIELFSTSTLSATSTATSTLRSFITGTTTQVIDSSTASLVRKDIQVDLVDRKIIASWQGGTASRPFYFCDPLRTSCFDSFVVAEGDFKKVDFYPGRNDVILYTKKDGLYVTEIDTRLPQNTIKLLSGTLDFETMGDRVFIREKGDYYELLFTASSTLNSISI